MDTCFSDKIASLKEVTTFSLDERCLEDFNLLKQCTEDASLQAIDEHLPFVVSTMLPRSRFQRQLSKWTIDCLHVKVVEQE